MQTKSSGKSIPLPVPGIVDDIMCNGLKCPVIANNVIIKPGLPGEIKSRTTGMPRDRGFIRAYEGRNRS